MLVPVISFIYIIHRLYNLQRTMCVWGHFPPYTKFSFHTLNNRKIYICNTHAIIFPYDFFFACLLACLLSCIVCCCYCRRSLSVFFPLLLLVVFSSFSILIFHLTHSIRFRSSLCLKWKMFRQKKTEFMCVFISYIHICTHVSMGTYTTFELTTLRICVCVCARVFFFCWRKRTIANEIK